MFEHLQKKKKTISVTIITLRKTVHVFGAEVESIKYLLKRWKNCVGFARFEQLASMIKQKSKDWNEIYVK